jgi:hypothetical protein
MDTSDKRQFYALLKDVHSFYRQDMTTFAATVWWEAMQPFSFEQVSKGFSAHAADPKHGTFLPKPADLVRILQGTHEDRSLMAWGKALEAMQRVGAYTSVVFDDPAIHAVVQDLGGWPKLCRSEHAELQFVQKRFCDAHAAYTRRGSFEFPRQLSGVCEIENSAAGRRTQPPVLVGDQTQARRVLELGTTGTKTEMRTLGQVAWQSLEHTATSEEQALNPTDEGASA